MGTMSPALAIERRRNDVAASMESLRQTTAESIATFRQTVCRTAFDSLSFGLKRKHVSHFEDSKVPEVRQRRIDKLIDTVSAELA